MASSQCFTEQSLGEIKKKLGEIRDILKPMEVSSEPGLKGDLLNLFRVCCSVPASADGEKLWETHKELNAMLNKIEITTFEKTVASTLKTYDRAEKINALLKILSEDNVDVSGLECDPGQDGIDFGLKLKKDFAAGSRVLEVSRRWVMDSDYFLHLEDLKRLVRSDPMLSSMPNVLLTFGLLFEAYNPESSWQPYIQSLPSEYTNICYFTDEDFELLRGCDAYIEALNLWRSVVRQYSYLHLKILDESVLADSDKSPKYRLLERKFNFRDYLWAAATVMTRLNPIPVAGSNKISLALIPVLDMFNHAELPYSVDYDVSEDKCIVYTPTNVTAGEPFKIFYGARPNLLMLLHNGFIPASNSFDFICFYPQRYTDNSLLESRLNCLQRLGLKSKVTYAISSVSQPWDGELRSYYRVMYACEKSFGAFSLLDDVEFKNKIESQHGVTEQSEKASLRAFKQHLIALKNSLPKATLEECSKGSYTTRSCKTLIFTQEKIVQNALAWIDDIIFDEDD